MSQFRQPRPSFFRGRHGRTLSSSSLSSYDGESTDSASSSSSDSDLTDVDDTYEARVRRYAERSHVSVSLSPSPPRAPAFVQRHFATPPAPGAVSKRQHLRLSLSLLRTRQSLAQLARADSAPPNVYETLAASLKALSLALPTDLGSLGVFLPILYRLAKDLVDELGGESGRRERRSLGKDEAKRLVALRQRWCAAEGGKAKGRERDGGDADWVAEIVERVERKPAPEFLRRPYDLASSTLLNGLESLLLPSTLPRLGLSDLGLTAEYLAQWELLERAPEVLAWYLYFESAMGDADRRLAEALQLLATVRSLDLSKNQLRDLPIPIAHLFPGLETLSLSNNLFPHLPLSLTRLSHLRRLKTHGNCLAKSRKSRSLGTQSNTRDIVRLVREKRVPPETQTPPPAVQPLVDICAQVLRLHLGIPIPTRVPPFVGSSSAPCTSSSSSDESDLSSSTTTLDPSQTNASEALEVLPPHLYALLVQSYDCVSCGRFTAAGPRAHLPDLFERVHHLDPGVSLPSQITPIAPPPAVAHTLHQPSAPMPDETGELAARLSVTAFPPLVPPSPAQPSIPHIPTVQPASTTPAPQVIPRTRTPPPPPPHLLTLDERILLALLGRGLDLSAFVVGPTRLCLACAAAHLGVVDGQCGCEACDEERRVRSSGAGGVLRWLRRKRGRSGIVGV